MRKALTPTPSTVNAVNTTTIPAPVGGWNARDALAAMPISDAEIMDNWFPRATDVSPRPGSETYCSGLPGQVESIFSYNGGASLKILCAVDGTIQNINTISTFGTIPTNSTIATGFMNDRWQYVNFATAGGNFLIAVNGEDDRQIYNGTTWVASTTIATFTSTIDSLTNLCVYQRRVFYSIKESLAFAYHEQVNAIGGTINTFPLGSLCQLGGELTAIGTWTRDGGDGMDDYIAFVTSRGEVVVYQGIDPGDANNWVLQGVYRAAEPLSRRCLQKFGGDLLIFTEAGLLPMSTVLSGIEPQAYVTDKIRNKIAEAVAIYRDYFGWEVKYHPNGPWMLLNVPVFEGDYQEQYVMNTQTGSWCRFQNLDANCFEVHDGNIYFGSNGSVIQADIGTNDDGNDVQVDVKQAESFFGAPGRLKHFKLFRPLISSDSQLSMAFGWNVDFGNQPPSNVPSATPVQFAEWDVATWDDFFWSDSPTPVGSMQSAFAIGTYGGPRIKGAVNTETVRWFGTDIVYEVGGML